MSTDAKNLISALLTVKPSERLDAEQALKNQWIIQSDDFLLCQDLGVNLEAFKKFHAKRKLKGAVSAVIAAGKIHSLGINFKEDLEEADVAVPAEG